MESSDVLSKERLGLMRRGSEIFNTWLEDLLENGLAGLEKAPESFDLMAAQMIDHKLNGFATQFKMMGQTLKTDPNWPGKILSELTLLQLATRRLLSWDDEDESTKFDLFNVFGINIKKEKLLESEGQKSQWLIVGIAENTIDNLKERKTYFIDVHGQFAMLIEYIFGRQKVKPLSFGQYYEAEMAYYPGSTPLRATPKSIYRINHQFGHLSNALTSLNDFSRYVELNLKKNPWVRELPFYLDEVSVLESAQQFILKDKHGGIMNVVLPVQWGRRLAFGCLESPLSLFGVWQKGEVQVLSAQIYGQYFMIE